MTISNSMSGFRVTGVYPLNRSAVISEEDWFVCTRRHMFSCGCVGGEGIVVVTGLCVGVCLHMCVSMWGLLCYARFSLLAISRTSPVRYSPRSGQHYLGAPPSFVGQPIT